MSFVVTSLPLCSTAGIVSVEVRSIQKHLFHDRTYILVRRKGCAGVSRKEKVSGFAAYLVNATELPQETTSVLVEGHGIEQIDLQRVSNILACGKDQTQLILFPRQNKVTLSRRKVPCVQTLVLFPSTVSVVLRFMTL